MGKKDLALGFEIGGTKSQVGIGYLNGDLLMVLRRSVDRKRGAEGIRENIITMAKEVLALTKHELSDIHRIGIGFGGIVQIPEGVTFKSYQINGWDNFPLKSWAEEQWGKPVYVQNDAGTAGLAESLHGMGRGFSRVFYITLGSGVGGAGY